ncbi:hypothetical protein V502_11513 [Pseudogymnoascus sp. VKM F-4520 (FW-2644)]|nr:hypothetical protein V502_11513 [Pseudogymnoascus sp. VKM F-4520 (FW-2644)]
MSGKITSKVSLDPNATQYYGILHISIQNEDGTGVLVRGTLTITLKSPAEIAPTDITVSSSPWQEFRPAVTNTQTDSSTFDVEVKLFAVHGYATDDSFSINIGVNGDLTRDTQRYTESIVITVGSD